MSEYMSLGSSWWYSTSKFEKNVRIHISWSYSGSDLLEKQSFHWVRARVTTSLLCPRYLSCANLVLECIGHTLEWTESAA